jgi:hypothetical protein
MNRQKITRAGILAIVLMTTFILCWEGFWRQKGFKITYNDDKALWAKKREEVYQPSNTTTVFIGSSRVKFDLDIPEWRKQTKQDAIQLALVGTSPLVILQDLADDEKFKGKLIVDITEELFFSQNPVFHKSANEAVSFYHKQTPSEHLSSFINFSLESRFVFLEERRFALNTLLNDLEIPNRPGVFSFPSFPKGFEWTTYDRQTYMSDMFLKNPNDINKQTGIWEKLILSDKTPTIKGDALAKTFEEIKRSVDKIKSRGGDVLFIRTPSSGPMAAAENKSYPRKEYWDALLAYTNVTGIHYSDFPETKNLICPEWSHLAPADVITYTHHLVNRLYEKGWFKVQSAANQREGDLIHPYPGNDHLMIDFTAAIR